MEKDWCTGIPDYWLNWCMRIVYIGDICQKHDISEEAKECSSTKFFKGLWNARIVGAIPIFIVASIACWIKYPKNMRKRI